MNENENLLTTKFSINHVYRLKAVARTKLFQLLDDSVNNRLTTINAPAGFGKTTLLSSWITMCKKRSIHAAWLTLDEEDNDNSRFWFYFISAMQAVTPDIGEKSSMLLKSSMIGGMETVITVLINEILSVKKKFLFILEDLHVIKDDEILKALSFFIKHIPNNISLIITSRKDISTMLKSIKISPISIKLTQEDLRFTKEETTFFIKDIMELKASEDEISKLYELTEGWPAGLQISALACKRKGITAITDKNIVRLETEVTSPFIEDILENQPQNINKFLIKTSLIDTFSYELAVYVTGMKDCKQILKEVLESNLFLSCLEEKKDFYRYHSLFSSFLKKTTEANNPELAKEVYLKTAQWYEEKGYIKEAASYYLKGKDFAKAVILIETISIELVCSGQFTLLQRWIDNIPALYLYKSSRLLLDYVWCNLLKHKINDARYYVEILEQSFSSFMLPSFEGEFLIAKAFVSMDNLEESISLLNKSMSLVDSFNANYPSALMSVATSYIIHGEVNEAENYYLKALTASKKIENLYSAAYSCGSLGMMMTLQGRLSEAETLYKETEEYLKEKGSNSIPLLGLVFSGFSEIYYIRNELDKAYEFSEKAIEYLEKGSLFDIKNNCYAIKSRTLIALGNKTKGIEAMNKATKLSGNDNLYGFKRHIDYCTAKMFLMLDSMDKTADFFSTYKISYNDNGRKYDLHDHILLAEFLMKAQKYELGLSCIENIMKLKNIGNLYEVQLKLIRADGLFSISKLEAAYDDLNMALLACEKENYIRIFIDYGNRCADILKAFVAYKSKKYDNRSLQYAKYILTLFNTKPIKAENCVDLLSAREFEVLKLISQGASNEEISKALFISISTVKSHILNIFGKLEVKSRSKAVVEAEKRGII